MWRAPKRYTAWRWQHGFSITNGGNQFLISYPQRIMAFRPLCPFSLASTVEASLSLNEIVVRTSLNDLSSLSAGDSVRVPHFTEAMVIVARFSDAFSRASCAIFPLAVDASNNRILGLQTSAREIQIRCLCPSLSIAPVQRAAALSKHIVIALRLSGGERMRIGYFISRNDFISSHLACFGNHRTRFWICIVEIHFASIPTISTAQVSC